MFANLYYVNKVSRGVGRLVNGKLDWARIDKWTADIIADDLDAITDEFARHRVEPPKVIWNPTPDQLSAPPLRFLATHWCRLTEGTIIPHVRQIDPFDLRPALGYLMVLDAIEHGRDFRYRLYGSMIAAISELDMTGQLLSEHSASPYVIEFGIAIYRAALERRQPIFSSRSPIGAQRTARWERFGFPCVDDNGVVVRLLASTVAIGLDGNLI